LKQQFSTTNNLTLQTFCDENLTKIKGCQQYKCPTDTCHVNWLKKYFYVSFLMLIKVTYSTTTWKRLHLFWVRLYFAGQWREQLVVNTRLLNMILDLIWMPDCFSLNRFKSVLLIEHVWVLFLASKTMHNVCSLFGIRASTSFDRCFCRKSSKISCNYIIFWIKYWSNELN
jgi:hypothetical protein